MNKIKWIVFDITGVLVHLTLLNPEGYTVGSRFFKQEDLQEIFSEKDYGNYILGTLSHEQFVSRFLHKKKLDLSVAEFDEIIKKDISPMKGMTALIEMLEKKYSIALATNEGKMLTQYKVEGSGIMNNISKIVPSYLLRERKPSIAFYKKMLNRIDASAEECIFIDDTKENVDVAKSLSMKGVLFQNSQQLENELRLLLVL